MRLLRERGPMRAMEIANALGIGRSSLSETLHTMELKVLVRRRGRHGPVSLTVPGVDVAEDTPMWVGALADAAVTLDPDDRSTLARLLSTLLRDVVARDHRSIATSACRHRWPQSMMRPPRRPAKLPFDTGFDD
jgi:DNA-binding MarR family transcriptional regulator